MCILTSSSKYLTISDTVYCAGPTFVGDISRLNLLDIWADHTDMILVCLINEVDLDWELY